MFIHRAKYLVAAALMLTATVLVADTWKGAIRTIDNNINNGELKLTLVRSGSPVDALFVGSQSFAIRGTTSARSEIQGEVNFVELGTTDGDTIRFADSALDPRGAIGIENSTASVNVSAEQNLSFILENEGAKVGTQKFSFRTGSKTTSGSTEVFAIDETGSVYGSKFSSGSLVISFVDDASCNPTITSSTLDWVKANDIVNICVRGLVQCASASTQRPVISGTLPSGIWPSVTRFLPAIIRDNGIYNAGGIQVLSNGTMTVEGLEINNVFTASGNKGFAGFCGSYSL